MTPARTARRARPSPREALLASSQGRQHRYHRYRALSQALTLAILYTVPLSGLARFDVLGGEHRSLFRAVNPFEGFVAIVVGIGALYLATFALNIALGRLFCGWGCPVSQTTRLWENVRIARRKGARGIRELALAIGFGALLSIGVLLWWISPEAIRRASPLAGAGLAVALASMMALTWVHGVFFAWGFCRKACPVGLYYSVVTMEHSHGVLFEKSLATCKDCGVCARVCPVGLDPRDLSAEMHGIGGLAFEALPSLNHCLSCGDCVAACEHVFRREDENKICLHFGMGVHGRPDTPREAYSPTATCEDHNSECRHSVDGPERAACLRESRA